jgi:cytochrome c oxidase cbb3-type subunit II
MFESKAGVFLVAGLIFFGLAFLSNAMVPALMYRNLPEQTAEQLVNGNLRYQFEDLANRYPAQFKAAFGTPPTDENAKEKWWNDCCAQGAARRTEDLCGRRLLALP